jgi:peptide chain release factor 2
MSANTIPPEDLEIGVWPPVVRTGMMTGTIPSGIYILHKPTGLGTICTSERSQFANKNNALKALNKLLEEL